MVKFQYKSMRIKRDLKTIGYYFSYDKYQEHKEVSLKQYDKSNLPVLKIDNRKDPTNKETTSQRQSKDKIAMWIFLLLVMYIIILYLK